MKKILIIGGSRNMGHALVHQLLSAGHSVTVLNRGIHADNLPESVHRLRADRTDLNQMRRALLAKNFDIAIDFVMYHPREAEGILQLLRDNVSHYIMISSGQVYLVREDIERPYREDAYAGRLLPEPKPNTYAHEEWTYGMNKRLAEDVLMDAHHQHSFPVTTLRLPMVNSPRDPFRRLYGYILRLRDGHPILVPKTPNYPLRHVYVEDVVSVLRHVIDTHTGIGRAYNIAQDETVTIDEFLDIMAEIMGVEARVMRFKNSVLQANGFVPDCSPFSDRWMSELDNTRSKTELGMEYTPLADYLRSLIDHYLREKPPIPVGYKRRQAEIQFIQHTPSQR